MESKDSSLVNENLVCLLVLNCGPILNIESELGGYKYPKSIDAFSPQALDRRIISTSMEPYLRLEPP